jgi:signal transduction histidine kinase
MKQVLLTCAFLTGIAAQFVAAQKNYLDSIRNIIYSTQNDTLKMKQFIFLSEFYRQSRPDSSYYYAKHLFEISQSLGFNLNQGYALTLMGCALNYQNKFVEALKTLKDAAAVIEDPNSEQKILPYEYSLDEDLYDHPVNSHLQKLEKLATVKLIMIMLYNNVKDSAKEFELIRDTKSLSNTCGNDRILATARLLEAIGYYDFKDYQSALPAAQNAYELFIRSRHFKYLGSVLLKLGQIYKKLAKGDTAIDYYWQAIQYSKPNYLRGAFAADLELSNWYLQVSQRDSSLWYAMDAHRIAEELNLVDLKFRSDTSLLAFYYSSKIGDSILKYQGLVIQYKDSTSGSQVKFQVALNTFKDEKLKQDEILTAKKEFQNRVQTYAFIIGFASALLVGFVLWRNNRITQLANKQLTIQKRETENQKTKVEQTLNALRLTQAQLVQSEKMASLGELTAGIAHEIQNPLNFVNNFSELNADLIRELKSEAINGNISEVITLANEIETNSEKINHHGKRADAIVKGMLQHSRSSSGQKEFVDINVLAGEYIKLSYQGFKAKEKLFDAKISTDFDPNIGKINIIQQEISRVLLNLYNNAFYAVNERRIQSPNGYKPIVSVTTKKINAIVEITVKDNGNGIPGKIREKIFQPFFTTKPTGQGTGLGLSLSYDIIKAHGGEIKVESKESKGTIFMIQLPFT